MWVPSRLEAARSWPPISCGSIVREATGACSQKARSGTLRTSYATLKEGRSRVLGPETAAFLEHGCVLIVATVGPDGEPRASRGWGVTLLDGEPTRLRLLLDADDPIAIGHLAAGG